MTTSAALASGESRRFRLMPFVHSPSGSVADGTIQIMKSRISEGQLFTVLNNARKTAGQSTPVVIRGDLTTKHEAIKRVMDICGKAGLWKIRFAALKEKA